MNRQEALQWCVENVKAWDNEEVSHNTLDIDEGWFFWFNGHCFRMLNFCENPESPITKQDWLEAKTNKEKLSETMQGIDLKKIRPLSEAEVYSSVKSLNETMAGISDRYTKGDTPQTPYMPKVGEECECVFSGEPMVGTLIGREGDAVWFKRRDGFYKTFVGNVFFRPLRTERELFIEQATKDYLDQVGSDAVNAKWFERIFGALYDAGNLSYKN